MDNQYTYYQPEQDPNQQYRRPKKKMPSWVKAACLGLVFGVVAAASFQTVNVVGDRIFGTKDQSQGTVKHTTTSGSTELTTSSGSTVTSDVAEISANAMPSIVSITNMSIEEVQNFFGGVQEQQSESAGSGIIIGQNDSELLIVTNNHVVEGNDTLTVTFIDEESVEANVKGTDANKDLAVVAVKLDDIPDSTMDKIAVATMGDSTEIQVGEPAIAIGNALGYGQSVTTGIISATERTMDGYDGTLLQTDAAINPGNSGGALLNMQGELIGINCAKIASSSVEGTGYAIPISKAQPILEELMNRKTRDKVSDESQAGYLGVKFADLSREAIQMYNMPAGAFVMDVVSGGAADNAGIQKSDIITKLDGQKVSSKADINDKLQYYTAGEEIDVGVARLSDGEYVESTITVTLGARPDSNQ